MSITSLISATIYGKEGKSIELICPSEIWINSLRGFQIPQPFTYVKRQSAEFSNKDEYPNGYEDEGIASLWVLAAYLDCSVEELIDELDTFIVDLEYLRDVMVTKTEIKL